MFIGNNQTVRTNQKTRAGGHLLFSSLRLAVGRRAIALRSQKVPEKWIVTKFFKNSTAAPLLESKLFGGRNTNRRRSRFIYHVNYCGLVAGRRGKIARRTIHPKICVETTKIGRPIA